MRPISERLELCLLICFVDLMFQAEGNGTGLVRDSEKACESFYRFPS